MKVMTITDLAAVFRRMLRQPFAKYCTLTSQGGEGTIPTVISRRKGISFLAGNALVEVQTGK